MQKLHDFLAHSSEESEETCSSPRVVMNQSTGKPLLYAVPFYLFLFIYFKYFLILLVMSMMRMRLHEFMSAICVQVSAEAWIPLYYNFRFPGTGIVGGCEPLV